MVTTLLAWLQEFVDQYQLAQFIHFRRKVVQVSRDGTEDAPWRVEVQAVTRSPVATAVAPPGSPIRPFVPLGAGVGRETAFFDHVAVCCGSNAAFRMPKYEGQESFRGRIIHSR